MKRKLSVEKRGSFNQLRVHYLEWSCWFFFIFREKRETRSVEIRFHFVLGHKFSLFSKISLSNPFPPEKLLCWRPTLENSNGKNKSQVKHFSTSIDLIENSTKRKWNWAVPPPKPPSFARKRKRKRVEKFWSVTNESKELLSLHFSTVNLFRDAKKSVFFFLFLKKNPFLTPAGRKKKEEEERDYLISVGMEEVTIKDPFSTRHPLRWDDECFLLPFQQKKTGF